MGSVPPSPRDRRTRDAACGIWVGRPGRLHEWFPVVATEIADPPSPEAAERGALMQRWITLATGMRFEEDVVTLDPVQRRFQYRIVGNPLITQHLATVDVLEDGPDRCIVVYSTDMEPARWRSSSSAPPVRDWRH